MARERDLAVHRENANLRVVGRIARRQHEGCLRIIELGGDSLHLRGRETAGIHHHGKRIAAEGAIGDNGHGDIAPLHLTSPVFPKISQNMSRHVSSSTSASRALSTLAATPS